VVEAAEEVLAEQMPSRRFEAWRKRSAIGAIATGIAFGLKEIFDPSDVKPVVSAPAPGDPPDDPGRMRVLLDPDDPTKAIAVFPAEPGPDPPADPS
jgi:hypothetical protein